MSSLTCDKAVKIINNLNAIESSAGTKSYDDSIVGGSYALTQGTGIPAPFVIAPDGTVDVSLIVPVIVRYIQCLYSRQDQIIEIIKKCCKDNVYYPPINNKGACGPGTALGQVREDGAVCVDVNDDGSCSSWVNPNDPSNGSVDPVFVGSDPLFNS